MRFLLCHTDCLRASDSRVTAVLDDEKIKFPSNVAPTLDQLERTQHKNQNSTQAGIDVQYFPAARILNERGDYSASMRILPPWVRPLLKKYHPLYRKGGVATANLAGLAVAAISRLPQTEWTFSVNSSKGRMNRRGSHSTHCRLGHHLQVRFSPSRHPRFTEMIYSSSSCAG